MSELSAEVVDYDLSTIGTLVEFDVSQDANIGWFINGTAAVDYVVEVRGREVGYREVETFASTTSVDDGRIIPEAQRARIRNTSTASGTADAVLGGA
jgi:hypothetical protein